MTDRMVCCAELAGKTLWTHKMCLCARVEDELSIKRKIRKAARANRLKNQERKKANALGTFESNLNHILKTLPLVQDEQSETRLPQQLQRCEQ
eukprot:COSAG03_NODE_8083_length_838_cov_2.469553_1_plen_92_part_10